MTTPSCRVVGGRVAGVLLALAILVLVGGVILAPDASQDESSRAPIQSRQSPGAPTDASLGEQDAIEAAHDAEGMPVVTPAQTCLAAIDRALAELGRTPTPAEAGTILQHLRDFLNRAQEQEAAGAVVAFLQTGLDAGTGLPFDVGEEGVLASSPSLRVMLLDLMPSLDPYVSVEVARQIMADGRSQDEYAMALRNLAWHDLDGDMAAELSAGFSRMMERGDWRAEPSAGFLEAFDIAVALGGPEMLEQVAGAIGLEQTNLDGTDQAIERAAFIAIDRIALRDPAALVAAFSEDPDFLSHTPRQRASALSRLDIEQPAQGELLVRYLESIDHGQGELEYFTGLFPNGNYLHGHRLVTADEATPTIEERQEMDRRVLAVVQAMESGMATEQGRAAAASIARRLEGFVAPPGTP